MKRQKHIRIVLLLVFCMWSCIASFAQNSLITYPFNTLTKAFNEIGFNPAKKGNSYFAVTADITILMEPTA